VWSEEWFWLSGQGAEQLMVEEEGQGAEQLMAEEEVGEASVMVLSVSSPGDTELTDTSGGLKRKRNCVAKLEPHNLVEPKLQHDAAPIPAPAPNLMFNSVLSKMSQVVTFLTFHVHFYNNTP
jgi:hypothetical protein